MKLALGCQYLGVSWCNKYTIVLEQASQGTQPCQTKQTPGVHRPTETWQCSTLRLWVDCGGPRLAWLPSHGPGRSAQAQLVSRDFSCVPGHWVTDVTLPGSTGATAACAGGLEALLRLYVINRYENMPHKWKSAGAPLHSVYPQCPGGVMSENDCDSGEDEENCGKKISGGEATPKTLLLQEGWAWRCSWLDLLSNWLHYLLNSLSFLTALKLREVHSNFSHCLLGWFFWNEIEIRRY